MKQSDYFLLSYLIIVGLIISGLPIHAQKPSHPTTGFSFAVYGDSRSMMYLPYKEEERDSAVKLMVDMFELVLPAKVSQEVVAKDVKLTYDPNTKELVQIVMPFLTASE